MNRDDALKKIKKCLQMANSANQYEAGAAMRQAQALMREYGVDRDDLQLLDVAEVSVTAVTNAMVMWENGLVNLVATAFGCDVFSRRTVDEGWRRVRQVVFVGLDAAPNVAGYAYEVLGHQCVKSRQAYIAAQPKRCKPKTKTARGDEFARGWVAAVRQLVDVMAMPAANAELVRRYMAQRYPDMGTAEVRDRGSRVSSQGHAEAGFRVGKSARLNRAVAGRAARPLLTRSE